MSGFEVMLVGAGMAAETAAMVGTALTVASVAASAAGTIAAGQAASANAKAQGHMAERTAKQFEARGKWEQAQGRMKADLAKRRKLAALGRAQTVASAGGFMFGDHTSSIAIKDLERWGSFDEFNENAMAKGQQWDAKNQAAGARYQAAAYRSQAKDKSYYASAAGTLMGGLGKSFSSYDAPSSQQSSISTKNKTGYKYSSTYA